MKSLPFLTTTPLGTNLPEEIGQLLRVVDLPDPFPTASFWRLHHDREADLLGGSQGLVHCLDAPLFVDVIWHTDSVAL